MPGLGQHCTNAGPALGQNVGPALGQRWASHVEPWSGQYIGPELGQRWANIGLELDQHDVGSAGPVLTRCLHADRV